MNQEWKVPPWKAGRPSKGRTWNLPFVCHYSNWTKKENKTRVKTRLFQFLFVANWKQDLYSKIFKMQQKCSKTLQTNWIDIDVVTGILLYQFTCIFTTSSLTNTLPVAIILLQQQVSDFTKTDSCCVVFHVSWSDIIRHWAHTQCLNNSWWMWETGLFVWNHGQTEPTTLPLMRLCCLYSTWVDSILQKPFEE